MLFDESAFRESMGQDPYLMADIVRLSLEDLPAQESRLREYRGLGNWEQVSRSAHAIKGVALSLSARDLSFVAQRLETASKMPDFQDLGLIDELSSMLEITCKALNGFLQKVEVEISDSEA